MKKISIFMAFLAAMAIGCGQKPVKKPSTAKKVKDLIYNLGHKDKAKRQKAEAGLVKIGKPAVKPLIAALEGKTARNTVGVGLLGTTGGGSAAVLKGDDSVPASSARALGKIGDKTAVGPLIKALGDANAGKAAADALKMITKQDFGTDAGKWKEWHDKEGG